MYTNDDTVAILERFVKGDKDAFNELKAHYENFVYNIIQQISYKSSVIDADDMKQQAFLIMYTLIPKYLEYIKANENQLPVKTFAAYCATTIKLRLCDYVSAFGAVPVHSRTITRQLHGIRKYGFQYLRTYGEFPTVENYLDAGFNRPQIDKMQKYINTLNSSPLDDNTKITKPSSDFTANAELKHLISTQLTPVEQVVINGTYYGGYNDSQIASKLSINNIKVGRIRRTALSKLKKAII